MSKNTKREKDVVLVVEDTAANHEIIQSFLDDIDVMCESAFDGMEAVTMCSSGGSNHYSLILMDINLPHMDGFETAKQMRNLDLNVPIIAITASDKDDARLKDSHKVFNALLFKPFKASEFFSVISPYIKNAGLRSLSSMTLTNHAEGSSLPSSRICDVEQAIANMGGNPRLFKKHFDNFKRNNVDLGTRMDILLQQKQYVECALLCHSVKGLAGMLGLTSLYDHVIQLETLLKQPICTETDHLPEEVSALLTQISLDIRLVCQMQF